MPGGSLRQRYNMNRVTHNFMAVAAAGLIAASAAVAAELPVIPLVIKNHKIVVEVAATQPMREQGLMNRFSLRPDQGMLFVFPQRQVISMWMRNTFIPLSVAFIDRDGRIINIADMQPQTENTHESDGPAVYALEMRKGWFKERKIAPGAKVEGLEKALQAE